MKWFKKIWFLLPLAVCLLLIAGLLLFTPSGCTLRSKPTLVIALLTLGAILILMGGGGYSFWRWSKKKSKIGWKLLSGFTCTVLAAAGVVLTAYWLFFSAFAYQPEHTVVRNGQKMVASVNSFTDVFVYYDEYKDALYRGDERLGEEWYGSGGYDPFTTEMEAAPKTSTFRD